MKNILVALLLLFFAAEFSFAGATDFCVRAAFNYGTIYGNSAEDIPWGAGFNAGFGIKFEINELVALTPAVEVDLRRESGDIEGIDFTLKSWAFDIPLLVRLNILPGFFAETGPVFAFVINTTSEMKYMGESHSSNLTDVNVFEFGFAFGLGYSVLQNLDLNFRLHLAATDMLDYSNISAKNIRLQWAIAYWFM